MIKLGPLVEQTIQKDFPECWTILADMMGLEYEIAYRNNVSTEEAYSVTIFVENEEIRLTKESGISTSAVIPKDIITQLIIHVVKANKLK